jgi:hypothetical protein
MHVVKRRMSEYLQEQAKPKAASAVAANIKGLRGTDCSQANPRSRDERPGSTVVLVLSGCIVSH